MLPNEPPIYVLPKNRFRAIIPQAIILMILGVIFYFGVLLNISLLRLNNTEEDIVKLLTLILLLFLIILGIFLSWHRAKHSYIFYRQLILVHQKEIFYQNIILGQARQDIWDKLFHTYSLSLGNNIFLRNIPQEVDIANYLRQLVGYNQRKSGSLY